MPTVEAVLSADLGGLDSSATAVFDYLYETNVVLLITGNLDNKWADKHVKSCTTAVPPQLGLLNGSAAISEEYAYSTYGDATLQFYGDGGCTFNDSGDLQLNGVDWTIEFWYMRSSSSYSTYQTIIAKRSTGSACEYEIFLNITNGLLGFYNGSTYLGIYPLSSLLGWYYIIFEQYNNQIYGYLDGSPIFTDGLPINTTANAGTNPLYIGKWYNSEYCNGAIKNLRITKGVARYGGQAPGLIGWGNDLREYVVPDANINVANTVYTPNIPSAVTSDQMHGSPPSIKVVEESEFKDANYWYGGKGFIEGIISNPDGATPGFVTIVDQESRNRLGTFIADSSGYFRINNLSLLREFELVGEDPWEVYSSAVKSRVVPQILGTYISLFLGSSGGTAVLKRPIALYDGKLEELRQTDSLFGFLKTWELYGDATNKNLSNGERILADTSVNAITLTLPAAPSFNAVVSIKDYAGNAANNNITINASHSFEGVASPYVISINKASLEFVFTGASRGWVITSSN